MAKNDLIKSVITLYAGKFGTEYSPLYLNIARPAMYNAASQILTPLEKFVLLNRVIRSRTSVKEISKRFKMKAREINKHEKSALIKLRDYVKTKEYETPRAEDKNIEGSIYSQNYSSQYSNVRN